MSDDDLPARGAGRIADEHPEVWRCYEALGRACREAGPIDATQARLVKLALALGAGSEGAVHSHVRRARQEGIDAATLRHVPVLAVTTLGFPAAMAGLTWVNDILDKE